MANEIYTDTIYTMRIPPQTKLKRFGRTFTKPFVDPSWDAAFFSLNWPYILNINGYREKKKVSGNSKESASNTSRFGVDSDIHYSIPTQLGSPDISVVSDNDNINYLDFLNGKGASLL